MNDLVQHRWSGPSGIMIIDGRILALWSFELGIPSRVLYWFCKRHANGSCGLACVYIVVYSCVYRTVLGAVPGQGAEMV